MWVWQAGDDSTCPTRGSADNRINALRDLIDRELADCVYGSRMSRLFQTAALHNICERIAAEEAPYREVLVKIAACLDNI